MLKKKNNQKIWLMVALIVIYRIILDLSYYYVIAPNFYYDGFEFEFSFAKYLDSYVLLLLLFAITPKEINRTSDLILVILFTLIGVPMLAYYSLSDQSRLYAYLMFLEIVLVIYVGKMGLLKIKITRSQSNVDNSYKVSIFFTLLSLIFLMGTIGFSRLNFDLLKIYEFRKENSQEIAVGFMPYIISWATKVFNLFLIVYSVINRKKVQTIIFIGVQLLFFGFLAHKTVLFYPLIILFVYLFMKWKHRYIAYLLGLILCSGIPLLVSLVADDIILVNIITRRVFFVPAFLNFNYFEFFSNNEYIYLSNSLLSPIVDYPYEITNTAHLIGNYLGRPDLGANTGFLGTSFMHFGYLGVIIFPLVIGTLIRLADTFSRFTPVWFTSGLILLPFINLFMSADLPVTLLTHGLLIGFILLKLIDNPVTFGSRRLN